MAVESSLTGKVARGAAWVFGAGLFARLLGAINTIVVARLLVPADIGIVAVAALAMQLLHGFSDFGVSQAVVKFREAGRDDIDTLFTLSVMRGLLIGTLLAVAAPVAAVFYADPRMLWAFLGIAFFPVITGFINPKFFEFERELRFSREFIATVLNKFAGVIVSIAVAFVFRTYWAIILGMLTGGLVQLVLSYVMRPYAPNLTLKSFRKLFDFSGWLAGVSFVAALNNKLDVPILARLFGGGGAGVYFMGFQLSEMATAQIGLPLTRAIYPGLSALQGDVERMRKAFLKGVSALGAFAMPAAIGFAFVAEDMVQLLLGDKWSAAAPVIQILAPVIGLQSLFYATQSYAMALGMTRLVFYRELIFFAVRLPVFIWAALTFGLMGAVWAAAAAGLFHVALNLALYAKASGEAFWQPLFSARRSFGAVVAMCLWFILLHSALPSINDAPLAIRLLADIVLGGAIYVLAHALLWRIEGSPDGVERNLLDAISSFRTRFAPR